ncbi:hypothetical protein Srufu_047450 [Streptomyces libani subsp. rufus]|nr:hypothetical protein Srufu_047450 [Streptomyces libani subsp. rufus]
MLTGLTSRDAIHERAGRSHAEAGRAAAATEPAPEPPASEDAAPRKTASAPEPSA